MYIDTHAHCYDQYFDSDPALFIEKAVAAGVTQIYMPNCDSKTIPRMLAMAEQFPDVCLPMMGLHPTYVKEHFEQELALVADWLARGRFIAVGEIGLDYYWDKTFIAQQKEAFGRQMDMAEQYRLPVSIHARESTPDCIAMVRPRAGRIKGVFHCFSGTLEEAKEVVALGFHLGIGGVVTYKRAGLQEIVRAMPLEAMVLETDAPYLAPVPYRSKRNESSYITFVAEQIALLKNVSIDEVAAITSQQAKTLFAVQQQPATGALSAS